MAENVEHGQLHENHSTGSWTSRLTKKIHRRPVGGNNNDQRLDSRADIDHSSIASSSPANASFEQSPATRRSADIDQQQPRPAVNAPNETADSPSAKKTDTIRASLDNGNNSRSGAGLAALDPPLSTIHKNEKVSGARNLDDDFIGLDMKGRLRRRSDLTERSPVSERSNVSSVPSPNPFARPSGTTPASRFFARRSLDRKSNDLPREQNITTSQASGLKESKDMSAMNSTGTEGNLKHPGDGYTSLPIYSEFKGREDQAHGSQPGDVTQALNKASALLEHDPTSAADNPTGVDGLETKVNRLALRSPEVLSPASFASAQNYFEPKEGERCEDYKNQSHPSAEEIIEKAKFNSADTTTHERTVPAVTHEVIQPQIHEITQEHVTRDIHHYHHVHRILPVHEVEVLPAKHYRVVNGVQVEMDPEQIPQSRVDAWESAIIPKIQQ